MKGNTTSTPGKLKPGRVGANVLEAVRGDIASGKLASGRFLPSVRELAKTHAVGMKTVWRVMKILESDGLVASQPRHGFTVLAKANDPDRGCPLAYVSERSAAPGEGWDVFHLSLFSHLQEAAARRGWSVLGLKADDFTAGQLADRLSCARAFGAIIDSIRPETFRAVKESGIPCLMVDAWIDGVGLDAVLQNGHMGGTLAARHLLARDCRRPAWFGPSGDNVHAIDRLGGALAALAVASPRIEPELLFAAAGDDLEQEALRMLSRRNRPDGVIALWGGHAMAVKRAADRLGLVPGRDFELVGWCAEEMYENFYRPGFGAGPVPLTATWSIRAMAEAAMSRLAERRETPALQPLWMKIPVTLRRATENVAGEAAAVGAKSRFKKRRK